MFQLHVHPEARGWIPRKTQLDQLKSFFSDPNLSVKLWPRHMASQILGRPTKPYEFRAFTRDDESHVFVDPTETPESIAWLIGHELCHRLIDQNETLSNAFADARPLDIDPAGDTFHEIDSAERFCDGIATRLLGYRQDRTWWRKQIPKRRRFT